MSQQKLDSVSRTHILALLGDAGPFIIFLSSLSEAGSSKYGLVVGNRYTKSKGKHILAMQSEFHKSIWALRFFIFTG
jgi:hypothetical protein